MIGLAQESWLYQGLVRAKSKWNLIAQDVAMAQLRQWTPDGSFGYWTDDWDGFPASRRRLLSRLAQARVANPVVITGDIHAFLANDLRVDFDDPKSPVVASEIVGTSISSAGPSYEAFASSTCPKIPMSASSRAASAAMSAASTHDARQMTARMQVVSDVTDPKASVSTLKTFAVESGKAGIVEA